MDHADHVALLRDGVVAADARGGTSSAGATEVWADLGAGTGAFTLALAELLPAGSTIHAVDRDAGSLAELERRHAKSSFSAAGHLERHVADFGHELGLAALDGVVMANSLHFVKDKGPVLARVRAMLKPRGRLLLVEYDSDRGNQWVPYPISFETWRTVSAENGFGEPTLLGAHASRFMRRIYSALSTRD